MCCHCPWDPGILNPSKKNGQSSDIFVVKLSDCCILLAAIIHSMILLVLLLSYVELEVMSPRIVICMLGSTIVKIFDNRTFGLNKNLLKTK